MALRVSGSGFGRLRRVCGLRFKAWFRVSGDFDAKAQGQGFG